MSTRTTNILYWVLTGLFSGFMIFSSMGGITLDPQAVALMHDHLGYPNYFIQWISVFKLIGAIAILLPMVPARLKEWAYFGFFMDLLMAVLSFVAVGDPVVQWVLMLIFIVVLIASYTLSHRRRSRQ